MPTKGYTDPQLTSRLFRSIRSLRQAQRQAINTWRTYEEAQAEIDRQACDGLIETAARHRIVFEAMSERWHVQTVPN